MRPSRSAPSSQQEQQLTFGLSYVPLIGAGPAVDPYLRINMHKDQITNLKKRPCSPIVRGPGHDPPSAPRYVDSKHLSFSRGTRFPTDEETFPKKYKAPGRAGTQRQKSVGDRNRSECTEGGRSGTVPCGGGSGKKDSSRRSSKASREPSSSSGMQRGAPTE